MYGFGNFGSELFLRVCNGCFRHTLCPDCAAGCPLAGGKSRDRPRPNWDDIIIAAIGTPVQVGIIAVALHYAVSHFGILPDSLQWILDPRFITAFYVVIGAWIISSFLHDIIVIYGHEFAKQSESDWDDRLIELLELIVKWLVWFGH